MRIIIICNSTFGLVKFRGMLIDKLLDNNDVIAVIPKLVEHNELISQDMLFSKRCQLIHIPIDRRGTNPLTDIKLIKNYRKVLKRLQPDLVITYTIKPNIYAGLLCSFYHIPYVVNITGLGTVFQKDNMLKKLVTFLYKKSLKKAKVVFFENIENKKIMVENNIVKERQAVVLNGAGVDLQDYSFEEYPNDCSLTRFLFMGRIMKEKGIDELFEAMDRLYKEGIPCSLDVLGNYEESYEQTVKKYENEGWLHFHGYQNDVKPFIKKCHCFVLPSYHEGMANTNLECAAMGRPLITTNIHGCKEAVINNVSGYLVENKNKEDLYEKMRQFCLLSIEEKALKGKAARIHMEKVFDKRNVVEKTLNAILD